MSHITRTLSLSLIALAAGSTTALAQSQVVVGPQVRMSPTGEQWHECSIAVQQDDGRKTLVMATGSDANTVFISYASFDWVSAAVTQGNLGNCGGGDVFLRPHPTDGTIFFTALQGTDGSGQCGGTGGTTGLTCNLSDYENQPISQAAWAGGGQCIGSFIFGWRKPSATTIDVLNDVYVFSNDLEDKPSLAIDTNTPFRTYLLRNNRTLTKGLAQYYDAVATTPKAGANAWVDTITEPHPNWGSKDYQERGINQVVLDNGRIVAVSRDKDIGLGGLYNAKLPYVIYSDVDSNGQYGKDWKPDPVNPNDTFVVPILIAGNITTIEATTTDTTGTGDTPAKVDRRKHAPSIAVERIPNMNDNVYVAFVARSAIGSTNTDVYISKSINAETHISFPVNLQDFLQITDSMLGLTGNAAQADQFVPAIAVDGCGDLNIMFYDNRNDPDLNDNIELVDVYFAHITGFGTLTPTITQRRLTPQSFRVDNLGQNNEPGFLGDYQNLAVTADGKTIYAAYIARDSADPVNGALRCYAHRIVVKCPGLLADFSGNGAVTQADATQFMAAFTAQDKRADVNLDWNVDVDDLLTFNRWFNQER